MIVVDASALVELLFRTEVGRRVESRLLDGGPSLHAPHLLDVEVVQVLRRFASRGELTPHRAHESLRLLDRMPLRRHPHAPLLMRVWALRDNLSAYDATYVALAEALSATLITTDRRLAGASGVRAAIEAVG